MSIKIKSFIIPILITLLSLLMYSCTSVQSLPEAESEYKSIIYNEQKNIVTEGETFLFFRTYDSYYNNPLDICNILKVFITFADVNQITANHVTLGFSLEDNFFGLALGRDSDSTVGGGV